MCPSGFVPARGCLRSCCVQDSVTQPPCQRVQVLQKGPFSHSGAATLQPGGNEGTGVGAGEAGRLRVLRGLALGRAVSHAAASTAPRSPRWQAGSRRLARQLVWYLGAFARRCDLVRSRRAGLRWPRCAVLWPGAAIGVNLETRMFPRLSSQRLSHPHREKPSATPAWAWVESRRYRSRHLCSRPHLPPHQ